MRYFFFIFFIFFILFKHANGAALAISISANPSTLIINTAVAGQNPETVSNTSTTYSINTDLTITSINGKLSSNMPTNVTLQVQLQAPTLLSVSTGLQTMTTTATNLVTNIVIISAASSKTITYQLSATIAAAQVTNSTRTLTLTIQ